MSQRSHSVPTVTLFPFLAVLVCIMGALIFLLLVTNQRMRRLAVQEVIAPETTAEPVATPDFSAQLELIAQREAAPLWSASIKVEEPPAVEEPAEPIELAEPAPVSAPELIPRAVPIPMEVVDPQEIADRQAEQRALNQQWEQRVAQLQSETQSLTTSTAQQQEIARAAQQKFLALQQAVKTAKETLAVISSQLTSEIPPAEQLQPLEARITALRERLATSEAANRTGASKYLVLPFDAVSGTTRRPIYIECSADSLRFLPENVEVTASDLEGFTAGLNPVRAATAALTAHWKQTSESGTEAPYVLLLVRPSGTIAYYYAMKLLAGLPDGVGYELVSDELQLEFPPADPVAVQVCREAITNMLLQRNAAMAAVRRSGESSGAPAGRSSRGATANSTIPADSAPGTARQGHQQAANLPIGNEEPLPFGSGENGFQVEEIQSTRSTGGRSWEQIDRFEGLEYRNQRLAGGTGAGGNGPDSLTGSSSPVRNSSTSQTNGDGSGLLTEGDLPPSPSDSRALSPDPAQDFLAADGVGLPPVPAAAELAAASDWEEPKPTSDRAVNAPAPASTRSAANSRSASQDDAAAPRTPVAPRSRKQSNSSAGPGLDTQRRLANLAQRRWGQSEPGASIALTKPVQISVDLTGLRVAGETLIPAGRGESSQQLFEMLLGTIDDECQTWGLAPRGFYWSPELRFEISPGGNQHLDRLQPWLVATGLKMRQEQTLQQPTTPAEGR